MPGPHTVIGIPTYGVVTMDFTISLMRIGAPLGATMAHYPLAVHLCTGADSGEKLATARNTIAQWAVDNDAKKLFFLDDDVLCPADVILRLDRLMDDNDFDLIGGCYWSKTPHPQPLMWRGFMEAPYMDWSVGEVVEVDWTGMGAMLINVESLQKIPQPWFSTEYRLFDEAIRNNRNLTEDIFFYSQAKKAGMKIWVDTAIQCEHQDRNAFPYPRYAMPAWFACAKPASPDKAEQKDKLLIANLGCGWEGTPREFGGQGHTVIRYDLNERVKPDIRCDVRQIPEPDQKFDLVYAGHVLEHFPATATVTILKEWTRIMKVGGSFLLKVPNLKSAFEHIEAGTTPIEGERDYPWNMVYGDQTGEGMFHKNGFTAKTLAAALAEVRGLGDIKVELDKTEAELVATATKAKECWLPAIAPEGTTTPAHPAIPTCQNVSPAPDGFKPIPATTKGKPKPPAKKKSAKAIPPSWGKHGIRKKSQPKKPAKKRR